MWALCSHYAQCKRIVLDIFLFRVCVCCCWSIWCGNFRTMCDTTSSKKKTMNIHYIKLIRWRTRMSEMNWVKSHLFKTIHWKIMVMSSFFLDLPTSSKSTHWLIWHVTSSGFLESKVIKVDINLKPVLEHNWFIVHNIQDREYISIWSSNAYSSLCFFGN